MSRSIKKGPYVHPKLTKKVEQAVKSNSREVIKTWSRIVCGWGDSNKNPKDLVRT